MTTNIRGFWLNEDTMLISHEETVSPAVSTRAAYDIVFQDAALKVVSFISPMSTGSSGGFVLVNSKWNQPRSGGTNPHNGVDLNASINTNVYAPYYGWSTKNPVVGHSDIEFLVDANRNKVKDDGDYYVRFYHMNCIALFHKAMGTMAIDKSDISFSYMTWCVTKQGYLSRLRFQSKSNQQKTERRNFFCRFYGGCKRFSGKLYRRSMLLSPVAVLSCPLAQGV